MQIPLKKYQFLNEQSLIVVTSVHEGFVYKALNGKIEKILKIDVEKKENEDDLESPGVFKGGVKELVHHGRSLEDKQQREGEKRKTAFLKKLKNTFNEIKNIENFISVYIFTPESIESELKNEIPIDLKNKIKAIFQGNFYNDHELELVRKIDSLQKEKKVVLTKEEASNILKRRE